MDIQKTDSDKSQRSSLKLGWSGPDQLERFEQEFLPKLSNGLESMFLQSLVNNFKYMRENRLDWSMVQVGALVCLRLDKERSYEARGGLAKSQPSIIPGMIKFVEKEVQNHRNDNSYRLESF